MKARKQRFALIMLAVLALSGAVLLVGNAFKSNIVFFHTPTEIYEGKVPLSSTLRIGGLVVSGSVKRSTDGLSVTFLVSDTVKSVPVTYTGILPDLFREGQGVVVQGRLQDGVFHAKQVLAKHDENYMPPEAAAALQRASKTLQAE